MFQEYPSHFSNVKRITLHTLKLEYLQSARVGQFGVRAGERLGGMDGACFAVGGCKDGIL